MNRTPKSIAGLLLAVGGILLLFQMFASANIAGNGTGPAAAVSVHPPVAALVSAAAYPTPKPPRPTITPISAADAATFIAKANATPSARETQQAATRTALPPLPTPGPLMGSLIIRDSVNRFSLNLPVGWYGSVPIPEAVGGMTKLANYNFLNVQNLPADGLVIQAFIEVLAPNQSFEAWIMQARRDMTNPENGAFNVTLSEPVAVRVGRYDGVSFVAYSAGQPSGKNLFLYVPPNRIFLAGYFPLDRSTEINSQTLSILASVQVDEDSLR